MRVYPELRCEVSEIADELATLVEEKNAAYGDSNGKVARIMEILFERGIPAERFELVLILVRVLDKVCRESNVEDEENWKDLIGYGLCAVRKIRLKKLAAARNSK